MDGLRQPVRVADQPIVLGARARDANRVRFLERVVANEKGRHLSGKTHDGDGVHQCVGQAGYGVGRSRPGGNEEDAGAPRGAGVALCGVGGSLLVPDKNMPDAAILEERVIDRQHRAARIAEDDLDPLVLEGLDHDFGACQHFRHQSVLPLLGTGGLAGIRAGVGFSNKKGASEPLCANGSGWAPFALAYNDNGGLRSRHCASLHRNCPPRAHRADLRLEGYWDCGCCQEAGSAPGRHCASHGHAGTRSEPCESGMGTFDGCGVGLAPENGSATGEAAWSGLPARGPPGSADGKNARQAPRPSGPMAGCGSPGSAMIPRKFARNRAFTRWIYRNQSGKVIRNSSFRLTGSVASGCQSGCFRGEATCASHPLRVSKNSFGQPGIGQG